MSKQNLNIRLDNDKIELTSNLSINYDRTNLPKQAFNFKTHQALFWKVEQIHYDSVSGTLLVRVIDYDCSINTKFSEIEPKYPINKLSFEKLDWKKFEPLLYFYNLSKLKSYIFNFKDKFFDLADKNSKQVKLLMSTDPNLIFGKSEPVRKESIIQEPVKQERKVEIKVKYEESKFDNSKIIFSVHLKPYKLKKQLEIANPNFRPEFEYIKPYFVKRMGKTFLAKIKLNFSNDYLEEISVQSDDIDSIDENVINLVRVSFVLDLRHFKNEGVEKILYTTNELSNDTKGMSLIDVSARDILEIFIENAKVKNVRQLEYLANDKQNLSKRVQFTIKPFFGFVFHEVNNRQCFIWELLNSHATYIWISRETESELDLGKVVEEAIATIKRDGRDVYKKYFKSIERPLYNFGVIEHSSNNLTEDERFSEWREKLQRFCSLCE